jgi:DnaJ-domain-containing protein 1
LEIFDDPYNIIECLSKICNLHVLLKNTKKNAFDDCNKVIDQFKDLSENQNEFYKDSLINRAELYILNDELDSAQSDLNKLNEKFQNDQSVHNLSQKISNLKRIASRKNYYKILGVSKTDKLREIKKAYRKKAIEFHPGIIMLI